MSVQITIIGLGQVGSSIGLALAGQSSIKRIGHDKNFEIGRLAQKKGAVDEFKVNLPASVADANVVILSLPLSEIRETLGYIAQDLQEGTVILDTAPAKATVATWIEELLPDGRYYVGLTPAIGAEFLHGNEMGIEAARADLFSKGIFLVNAPQGTPGEAVKLATDLVGLLGAQAMISDAVEADGLLASTHVLPQLVSAALLNATVDKPGWLEARKVAARPYATGTASVSYEAAKSLSEAALENRANVVRMLDTYMASLQKLRNDLEDGDAKAVVEFLESANQGRDRWLNERTKAEWQTIDQAEVQSFGDKMSHLFLGGILERARKRK
jgi:prephenate dehydrogenase